MFGREMLTRRIAGCTRSTMDISSLERDMLLWAPQRGRRGLRDHQERGEGSEYANDMDDAR
jgi:hypothetical protein